MKPMIFAWLIQLQPPQPLLFFLLIYKNAQYLEHSEILTNTLQPGGAEKKKVTEATNELHQKKSHKKKI